jgi:hypothetical protein
MLPRLQSHRKQPFPPKSSDWASHETGGSLSFKVEARRQSRRLCAARILASSRFALLVLRQW